MFYTVLPLRKTTFLWLMDLARLQTSANMHFIGEYAVQMVVCLWLVYLLGFYE